MGLFIIYCCCVELLNGLTLNSTENVHLVGGKKGKPIAYTKSRFPSLLKINLKEKSYTLGEFLKTDLAKAELGLDELQVGMYLILKKRW